MAHSISRLLLVLPLCLVLPASAQTTAAPAQSSQTKPSSPGNEQNPPEGGRPRISKGLSSTLSAGIQYQPPPPPKTEEEEVDLRDVDKPRNQIIRLPKYVVEAERPPVFSERDLYTRENLRELASKRYLSQFQREVLNKWRIGQLDQTYAMMSYQADERMKNINATNETISLYRKVGDDKAADELQRDAYETYLRRSDITTKSEEDQINGRIGVQKNY